MNGFALGGVFALLIVVAFWSLFRKALTPERGALDVGQIRSFSVDYYRPMTRLLAAADVDFLKAQPGYEPQMAKKLQAARRTVFRVYLKKLNQDFQLLHRAARILVVNAPKDQPQFAGALLRQSIWFQAALTWVHFQLCLHALGLGGIKINVEGVVRSVRLMQERMQILLAANTSPVSIA